MLENISAGHIDHKAKGLDSSQTRKAFAETKLTFVEPKLIKHGDATEITAAGFFGQFSPGS